MRAVTACLAAALAAGLAASAAAGPGGGVQAAWTQLAPGGLLAKAVTTAPSCPAVRLGGSARLPMTRVTPPAGLVGFDGVLVCRAALPASARSASVEGRRLPLLAAGLPRRVGVLGDTGCFVPPPAGGDSDDGTKPQRCARAKDWPFAAVAASLAAARPTLVVHVGDYIYRQGDCADAARCGGSPPINPPGSPNPDNWALWRADFFDPAAPLLAAAPLVFVRGNHELCSRAGNGYFLLLDPGANAPGTCGTGRGDLTPPYLLRAGPLRLAVVDSAGACDYTGSRVAAYRAAFRRASALVGPPGGWLLTHRPLFAYQNTTKPTLGDSCSTVPGPSAWKNATEQAAAKGLLAPRYALILSGHVHVFQAVSLPGQPPQLVLGNGGTSLTGGLTKNPAPPAYGPPGLPAPAYATTVAAYGYVLLVPAAEGGWAATLAGADGASRLTCRIGAALTCP